MDAVEQTFQARAEKHSKRAVSMWIGARHLLEHGEYTVAALLTVRTLTSRAIDEFKSALNTLDFLRRYRNTIDNPRNARPT